MDRRTKARLTQCSACPGKHAYSDYCQAASATRPCDTFVCKMQRVMWGSFQGWLRVRVRLLRQVEMAALDYRASRLVRTLDPVTGKRGGFDEGSEVVSARCASLHSVWRRRFGRIRF